MKTTHLNDLFDQMEPEIGNKLDDKIQIEGDEVVKELNEIFETLPKITHDFMNLNPEQSMYYEFNRVIIEATSKEINKFFAYKQTQFNKEKKDFKAKYLGIFLSALINNSKDEEITLDIIQPDRPFSYLGYMLKDKKLTIRNSKKFVMPSEVLSGEYNIIGNVFATSTKINNCKLNIQGTIEYAGLSLKSGEIYVEGEVEHAGTNMKNGILHINGNVTTSIGVASEGGEIHLNGKFPKLFDPRIVKADLYHNGKTIVRNGKLIDSSYVK